jgi:hypothetical protein
LLKWKYGKSGEGAQNLFLYPNIGGRHGGEWKVPGEHIVLTCKIDHKMLVDASQYKLTIHDPLQKDKTSKMLSGKEVFSFEGMNMQLTECDESGIWANMKIWTSPGHYFKWTA